MKKIIFGVILSIVLIISACSYTDSTRASLPDGFTEVSYDDTELGSLTVLRHNATGCHYVNVDGSSSGSFVQMFVQRNGVSIPYCD